MKPGRYAAFDVGTNSVKLTIADLSPQSALPVFDRTVITRLGEGMASSGGMLSAAAMQRTLDALAELVGVYNSYSVLGTVAVGTAALREALNRAEFLHEAQQRIGLKVEVISGEEEARLSYLAVRLDPHWRHCAALFVIDIGGGSTEIIEGHVGSREISARRSLPIGAVKLTERYLNSDPVTSDELAAADGAATEAFGTARSATVAQDAGAPGAATAQARRSSAAVSADSSRKRAETPDAPDGGLEGDLPAARLVGVGGTMTNLASMALNGGSPEQIHGYALTRAVLSSEIALLASKSVAERRSIPGLDPRRADIILGGATLLSHALAHLGRDSIDVSTRGLRWGALYDRFMDDDIETRLT